MVNVKINQILREVTNCHRTKVILLEWYKTSLSVHACNKQILKLGLLPTMNQYQNSCNRLVPIQCGPTIQYYNKLHKY